MDKYSIYSKKQSFLGKLFKSREISLPRVTFSEKGIEFFTTSNMHVVIRWKDCIDLYATAIAHKTKQYVKGVTCMFLHLANGINVAEIVNEKPDEDSLPFISTPQALGGKYMGIPQMNGLIVKVLYADSGDPSELFSRYQKQGKRLRPIFEASSAKEYNEFIKENFQESTWEEYLISE
jgi:hypothetical protein